MLYLLCLQSHIKYALMYLNYIFHLLLTMSIINDHLLSCVYSYYIKLQILYGVSDVGFTILIKTEYK